MKMWHWHRALPPPWVRQKQFSHIGQGLARIQLDLKAKSRIFESLVVSRLLHGLSACCFNISQRRRLDGFQARCLRTILGIKCAFLSRVSNKEVLRRAGQPKILLAMILEQQLDQLGKLLRASDADPLRKSAFAVGTTPVVAFYVRRVGRPRKEWAPSIMEEARRRNHAQADLQSAAADAAYWSKEVVLK